MSQPIEYGMEGERPYDLYYQHSGATPVLTVLLAGLAGCVVAVAGALVYAYVDLYIPIIYANILATVGFGALIGFVTAAILKRGRVRSMHVGIALVIVITLVGYYFSWVFWVKATFDRYAREEVAAVVTIPRLIQSPRMLWECASGLNEHGTWSLGHASSSSRDNSNVSGVMLDIVWLAEALVIFGLAIGVTRARIGGAIYCERCDRWCGPAVVLRRTAPGDAAAARQGAEAHDFSHFATLGAASGGHYWELQHEHCGQCNELHTLSVRDVTITTNKKGEQSTKIKKVINRLLVTPEEVEELRVGPPPVGQVPEPVAPPPPPAPPVA
jgi:hypothetical protein